MYITYLILVVVNMGKYICRRSESFAKLRSARHSLCLWTFPFFGKYRISSTLSSLSKAAGDSKMWLYTMHSPHSKRLLDQFNSFRGKFKQVRRLEVHSILRYRVEN